MRRLLGLLLLAAGPWLLLTGCAPREATVSLAELRPGEWVDFWHQPVVRRGEFTLTAEHGSPIFIQKGNAEKALLYGSLRGAHVLVGHTGRYILINDFAATKNCWVYVADLNVTPANPPYGWRYGLTKISEAARAVHDAEARRRWPGQGFAPEAAAFSPDDSKVLITMPPQVQMLPERHWPTWSYVVDARNGAVLHQYQSDGRVPRRWWEF